MTRTMTDVLIDRSFLYAYFALDDKYHQRAIELGFPTTSRPIVTQVVLPEVAFLFKKYGGIQAAASFIESFTDAIPSTECLTEADLRRAREIMITYGESKLDFVDCCIMALSERLNIQQVCTFDRRDFPI